MITTIDSWTLAQLQSAVVFGISAGVLIVIVPAVIIFLESRHAKRIEHGSGFGHIMAAAGRAGILTVVWLLFITIVFFLIVGSTTNLDHPPAYGVWAFWNVDWLNPSVLNSLSTSSTIYQDHGEQGQALARSLVFGMTIIKYIVIFSAGWIFLMLAKFALWSQLRTNGRQEYTFGDIISSLLLFMASIIMFAMIVRLMNTSLSNILEFSAKMGKPMPSNDIDIFNDFWLLLKNGLTYIST